MNTAYKKNQPIEGIVDDKTIPKKRIAFATPEEFKQFYQRVKKDH